MLQREAGKNFSQCAYIFFPLWSVKSSDKKHSSFGFHSRSEEMFNKLMALYFFFFNLINNITFWRCEKRGRCGGQFKTAFEVSQGDPLPHSHPPDTVPQYQSTQGQ